jgi:anti-sigma regulatory factor (Ser/Thr protein kinase)
LPNPKGFSIGLYIQSRLDQVRLIRAAMSGVLNHLRVAQDDIYALELAVTEIANNSVEHGYEEAEDKQIEVIIRLSGRVVEIDMKDSAELFPEAVRMRLMADPEPIEEPDEQWTMRGHGLLIVGHLVDSINLTYEMGHNCISMKRRVALI